MGKLVSQERILARGFEARKHHVKVGLTLEVCSNAIQVLQVKLKVLAYPNRPFTRRADFRWPRARPR